MATSARADLSFFDGEPLLRIIATALVQLSRQQSPGTPVYDDTVQRAFNHLVLLCLRRGVAPPGSVPDMVSWAARLPLREWPLDLPEELVADGERLVDRDTRTPTQACVEWAVTARDPAAEQFENLLLEEALTACRAAASPASYTAFRKLLITQPVLTGTELALLAADLDLGILHEIIKRSYEPATAAYRREGQYALCKRCSCLLVPVRDGLRCELDRCRRDGRASVARMIDAHADGGVYQLARPLRMFITGPGLAETDLETDLVAMGLRPEMWPNFDAYDLRITFPDQRVWAIDVKDRANPALLGRTARPFRAEPRYDRAFLVVPAYRFVDREDYARVFERRLAPELAGRIELLSDEAFVRTVRARLRGPRSTSAKREGDADA